MQLIPLVIAATIVVVTERPAAHVDLSDEHGHVVSTRRIDAEAREARFANLAAGVYKVVLRGEHPLEQLSVNAAVGADDDRRLELNPKPQRVTLRVKHGGSPARDATLELKHVESGWGALLKADAQAVASGELWQPGQFELAVRGAGLVTPYVQRIELAAGETAVEIPAGVVGGFVRDASGASVANAAVTLKTSAGGLSSTVRTATDGMGRFDFTAVRPGRQTVRVSAPGFLRGEPLTFDGDTRELDLVVDRGVARDLTVTAPDGTPIAGAYVAAAHSSGIVATAITGEDGKATIATTGGGATLFVVPKDGSFAIRRIGADEKRVRVDVPAAAASLEVALLTTSGTPIPDVSLLLRYNGELVPPDVARELERRQRLKFVSGSDGRVVFAKVPRGVYELWPYGSEEEAEAIVASASALEAPANVHVVTGENRVTMRFRSR